MLGGVTMSKALVPVCQSRGNVIDADFREVIPRPAARHGKIFDIDGLLRRLTKAELIAAIKNYGISASSLAHCLLMDAYGRSSLSSETIQKARERAKLATSSDARRRARLAAIAAEKARLDIDAEIERWKAFLDWIKGEGDE